MVEQFFTTLTTAGEGFSGFMISLLQSIWGFFYTSGADGSGGEFTSQGLFVIVGLAASFVFFGLRWISRLFHLRG